MTDEDMTPAQRTARAVRRAFWLGVGLSLACRMLPPQHQDLCRAIASACTGGLIP